MSEVKDNSEKKTSKKRNVNDKFAQYCKTGGPGRPKGVPNKFNRDIVQQVIESLETLNNEFAKDGGYLVVLGKKDPKAYAAIVKTIIPRNINLSGKIKMSYGQLLTGQKQPTATPAED